VSYLFITDVLTPSETSSGAAKQWGKVVVQIHSHPGFDIASVAAIAKLIAIKRCCEKVAGDNSTSGFVEVGS
jgi:hypothetical protein